MTDATPRPTSAAPLPPAPALLRWTVLVLVSLAMFGNYYAYDAVAPLAETLQRLLGFTDTQLGTLNALYSVAPIAITLLGGVIVDRLGARFAVLLFTAICLVGAALTAATPSFTVMAIGRLIFGLGAESMIVAVTTALGQWFVGRQLGFAFGVNLSIARAGSYSADLSPTWFGSLYEQGWQPPLVLAAGVCAFSLVAAVVYFVLERTAGRRYALPEPSPSDRFVWSDLWRFDRSFWYVIALCVTFYSVVFPFRSTFSIKYFQHAHDLSLQDAGQINGFVFFAAIFATPIFGLLVDVVGRRAFFMAGGTLLLFVVFPILAYTEWSLWVATILIGVAFSLVPAVMWPAVPYLVEKERLGTAYGLMTMLQNIGMAATNFGAGRLNDVNHAGADNPSGYGPMLALFGLLSLAGLVFAWLLRQREVGPEGHDLELPTPRSKTA